MGLEDWIERAVSFMKMARMAYNAGVYNLACFNAHQAVERALSQTPWARTPSPTA